MIWRIFLAATRSNSSWCFSPFTPTSHPRHSLLSLRFEWKTLRQSQCLWTSDDHCHIHHSNCSTRSVFLISRHYSDMHNVVQIKISWDLRKQTVSYFDEHHTDKIVRLVHFQVQWNLRVAVTEGIQKSGRQFRFHINWFPFLANS